MKFRVSAEMGYETWSPGTIILNINALRTYTQHIVSESFTVTPQVDVEELLSFNGENRFMRLQIPANTSLRVFYEATIDNTFRITDNTQLTETPIGQMAAHILPYLYPSRYCQSDRLFRLANNMFGHIINPFDKVIALTNWINKNVQYISGFSNAQTSAYDTVTEQAGVCRDFAHLGIALCRALTIPARYFTCYAYNLNPPDFHACFEAYLGGEWVLFDATRLVPLNGLIKIATGRDAADTAVANIFGNVSFNFMQVQCDLVDENFQPYFYYSSGADGLSYV